MFVNFVLELLEFECFPEKSSWCRNVQVCQGVKCKLSSPTDWIMRYMKTYHFYLSINYEGISVGVCNH